MWKWLLHLGTIGDYNSISFTCPPSGSGGAGPTLGFYDGASVASAYDVLALASVIAVLVIVLVTYLGTSKTLGPRFVFRWYWGGAVAAIGCAVLAYTLLSIMPTHAAAGTCPSNLNPFLLRLPASLIMTRAVAGFVWGLLAYVLFSVILTATIGRFAAVRNGFFHNRGCPFPRFVP